MGAYIPIAAPANRIGCPHPVGLGWQRLPPLWGIKPVIPARRRATGFACNPQDWSRAPRGNAFLPHRRPFMPAPQPTKPVELPLPENVEAQLEGETVWLTFRVFSDEQPQTLLTVRVPLDCDQAEKIHAQLGPCAKMARIRFRQRS